MKFPTCVWSRQEDDYDCYYETSCNNAFILNDGTPKKNKMRYCCYCGHLLKEKKGK